MTIENAGAELLPVQGLVTVELADARTGRVLHRETQDNFLSLQSLRVARWWQRMMWGAYNPVQTNDSVSVKPTEMPWFPAQHLGYWNDATAEASSTEDRLEKDLVGWASRQPVGSPSGKRGVVNITESAFSDTASKWVFDWTTSQGNGTFQSVGWTRINETTGFPIARFPEDDSINFTNAGSSGADVGNPLWWDAGGSLWNLIEWTGTQYRVASAAAGGGTTTQICLIPTTWGGQSVYGLARLGTDIVLCGQPNGSNPRLGRYTSAGVQTWLRTESSLTTRYNDCTIDGSSNIWTCDSAGTVRRHSNSDGTVSASVAPVLAPTRLDGIAYDAGDGNFWVIGTVAGVTMQMWKMDSSGNTVGPLLSLSASALLVTSTTPFSGTYGVPGSASREPYTLTWPGTTTTPAIGPTPTRLASAWLVSTGAALAVKGTEIWVGGRSNTGSEVGGTGRASAVRGGTLGTRTKLAAAITKTNAQTLKITYQFNFS